MEYANNAANSINQKVQSVGNSVKSVSDSITQSVQSVGKNVTDSISQYGDPQQVATTSTDFLQSNTMAAKVAVTLLVLLVFVLLLVLGINMIGYFTQTSTNPYIVKGMIAGSNSLMLHGNQVLRSNNMQHGMEFTWAVWIQVNDIVGSTQQYQHVFNKGNGNYSTTPMSANGVYYSAGSGLATVNNGPGLYLGNSDNNSTVSLHVVMDSMDATAGPGTVDVAGIPLNKKWMLVVIRLENTMLDVYVNGTISGRYNFTTVPKQNYGDIYVCQNGGFSGLLSNLRYYAYALSASEIGMLLQQGPNITQSTLANTSSAGSYDYLSNWWYFSKVH